ncbi:hypothetical protein PSAC2689_10582 [Paraburkholderia sacchari]|uniref:hypothetical protein n=1 Tax=Paraburkholderia sacchari TaxID=159450 RepID=UPI0039A4BA8C
MTWLIALGAAPTPVEAGAPTAGVIERTPFARYHRCRVRLSAWLRDKVQLGKTPLETGVEHYIVYLTDPQSAVRFALVPPRVAEIYDALDASRTRAALSDVLRERGHAAHTEHDDECLAMLARCHAIRTSADGLAP